MAGAQPLVRDEDHKHASKQVKSKQICLFRLMFIEISVLQGHFGVHSRGFRPPGCQGWIFSLISSWDLGTPSICKKSWTSL